MSCGNPVIFFEIPRRFDIYLTPTFGIGIYLSLNSKMEYFIRPIRNWSMWHPILKLQHISRSISKLEHMSCPISKLQHLSWWLGIFLSVVFEIGAYYTVQCDLLLVWCVLVMWCWVHISLSHYSRTFWVQFPNPDEKRVQLYIFVFVEIHVWCSIL